MGNTAEEFWASLLQGRSGIGPITRFDATGYPTRIAGELKGFEPAQVHRQEGRPQARSRTSSTRSPARRWRWRTPALEPDKVDGTRFGVLVGSGIGGITTLLEQPRGRCKTKGLDRVSPFFIPMLIVNMALGPDLDALRRQGAQLLGRDRLRHAATTPSATPPGSSSAATPT